MKDNEFSNLFTWSQLAVTLVRKDILKLGLKMKKLVWGILGFEISKWKIKTAFGYMGLVLKKEVCVRVQM